MNTDLELKFLSDYIKKTPIIFTCLINILEKKKLVKRFLVISELRLFIIKYVSFGRKILKINSPICLIKELSVEPYESQSSTYKIIVEIENSRIEIISDETLTKIIVKSIYTQLRKISQFIPENKVANVNIMDFGDDLQEYEILEGKKALLFLHTIICDELNINENVAISCFLQSKTSVVNFRDIFFPTYEISIVYNLPLNNNELFAFSNILSYSKTYVEFLCKNIILNEFSLLSLLISLFSNDNFDIISLVNCKLNSSVIKKLSETFEKNQINLSELNFSLNKLGDDGLIYLTKVISHSKIKKLILSNCSIYNKGILSFSNGIINSVLSNSLKVLNLSYNSFKKSGSIAFMEFLKNNECLKSLKLKQTDINIKLLFATLSINPHMINKLKLLNISENRITELSAAEIGNFLSKICGTIYLNLSKTKLNEKSYLYIMNGIKRNPKIDKSSFINLSINFSNNDFDDYCGNAINDIFKDTACRIIKHLDFSSTFLKKSTAISLIKSLSHFKSLESLILDENIKMMKSSHGDENDLSNALIELSHLVPSLKYLSMNGSDSSPYTYKNKLNKWFENLGSNNSLEWISIQNIKFSEQEYEIFVNSIVENHTIKVIHMDLGKMKNDMLIKYATHFGRSKIIYHVLREELLYVDYKNYKERESLIYEVAVSKCLNSQKYNSNRDSISQRYIKNGFNILYEKEGGKNLTSEEKEREKEKQKGKQFGVDIIDIGGTTKIDYLKERLPTVLIIMKSYLIDNGGLKSEGIFRKTPENNDVNETQASLDHGNFVVCKDINSIATCIKIWFRNYPIPIIDSVFTDKLPSIEYDVETIGDIIQDHIREPNYSLLIWLLDLCSIVASNEKVNKMSALNLSIVFVPNLFKEENPAKNLKINHILTPFFEKAILWRMIHYKHCREYLKPMKRTSLRKKRVDLTKTLIAATRHGGSIFAPNAFDKSGLNYFEKTSSGNLGFMDSQRKESK